MKITKIVFENFKPYHDNVEIDLSINEDKNIILIGGRNGQGKTSFLVGVVWCLYGSKISEVDEIYKKEVKGNYSKFLSKSLNWTSKNNNNYQFLVELIFEDVQLPNAFSNASSSSKISIKRQYNTQTTEENFDILIDGQIYDLLSEEADKINFINDYIIPIDIAKFVFFDAEKISEIASLSAKDQAVVMNKALGEILGLNIYENLVKDLETYESNLQKEAASTEIKIQINSFENAKTHNELQLETIEKQTDENEERIEELKIEISESINELIKRGDASIKVDVEALRKKEELLNEKLEEVGKKFNEVADLIPLSILGHKLEEVMEHIELEEKRKLNEIKKEGLTEQTKEFADKLFNKPPLPPPNEDIDMEQKSFYYKKAKEMLVNLYTQEQEEIKLDFEHELDNSDIQHLKSVFNIVQRNSKDIFASIFSEYLRIQNDYQDAAQELKIAETSSQDEFVQEIQDKRNEAERTKSLLVKEVGRMEEEKIKLTLENNAHQTKIDNLLTKVKISKKIEKQVKVTKKYIKTLNEFIKKQKEQKRQILEKNLIRELGNLLDKKGLISNVEITILQNNMGLDVKLFNDEGRETNPSTDLSKGEQQLYISALLKSILSESIHNLPVLIDTPLGRLDQDHRNNILKNYYPYLSEQVIIFSTNTEIRVADLPKIKGFVSKAYRLENIEKKTSIHPGYFEKA